MKELGKSVLKIRPQYARNLLLLGLKCFHSPTKRETKIVLFPDWMYQHCVPIAMIHRLLLKMLQQRC
ncbi:hypothetical protein ACHAW6_013280 [Cyclotella cf. meneghiniana]